MGAAITAIVTALLAFLANLGHDVWAAHEARKTVAAAPAGELGAYLRLLRPEAAIENLREFAQMPHAGSRSEPVRHGSAAAWSDRHPARECRRRRDPAP
jgi:hypothetical protein